jgi:hypothetical protein
MFCGVVIGIVALLGLPETAPIKTQLRRPEPLSGAGPLRSRL